MSRGKRYDTEPKLNYQKVFAVLIAIAVVIMFIFIMKNVLKEKEKITGDNEYFALYAQNKWGVINQNGEEIIKPSYQEMIVIPNKEKDVFICIYNIDEQSGEYKTKALNSKNEEILTGYEQIEALENIDENDNVWYEENILKIKKNGKYGLIDFNGKELLPAEYDEITVLEGIENSIIIKKDGLVGLANDNGSIIVEVAYSQIKNLGNIYKNGYITVNEQGKYGLISTTKKQILENKYEEIAQVYLHNYYLVKENGVQKLVDSKGNTIIENGFDEIKSVTLNGIIFVKDGLYGEMNTTGEVTIEPKYQYLKETKDGTYIAKLNDKFGVIDNLQNINLEFNYTGLTYNENANLFLAEDAGYKTSVINDKFEVKMTGILSEINIDESYIRMRIDDEYKYYNLKGEEKSSTEILKENTLFLSKKDGKYGYVDKKGNVVVDYIYDDATEQNQYGFAAVKANGLWGSINSNGKEIIEPKYNLENNLIIDFIGKWHLGEDLNMNYYCEK
ncbi:MAG: WG repeat-containing protein [Clostridia bacterium]|nr:WG repeat-containing protein [Clostridia bacterium]